MLDEGPPDATALVVRIDGERREHRDPTIATVVADDRMADHHVPDDLAGTLGHEGHLGYVLGRGADPVDEVGLGLRREGGRDDTSDRVVIYPATRHESTVGSGGVAIARSCPTRSAEHDGVRGPASPFYDGPVDCQSPIRLPSLSVK